MAALVSAAVSAGPLDPNSRVMGFLLGAGTAPAAVVAVEPPDPPLEGLFELAEPELDPHAPATRAMPAAIARPPTALFTTIVNSFSVQS